MVGVFEIDRLVVDFIRGIILVVEHNKRCNLGRPRDWYDTDETNNSNPPEAKPRSRRPSEVPINGRAVILFDREEKMENLTWL